MTVFASVEPTQFYINIAGNRDAIFFTDQVELDTF
jgi:hypothetical protein